MKKHLNKPTLKDFVLGRTYEPEMRFNPFHKVFKYCAFAMAISLVYPNKHNTRFKIFIAFLVIGFNSVAIFWFFTYLFSCLIRLDTYNFTRNMTIGIVVFLFFFKSFYANFKTDIFTELFSVMNNDLMDGNFMDEDYQNVYEEAIKMGKFGEKCWIVIPLLLSSMFPISASGAIIYKLFRGDKDFRVMVHEMELKFIEDKKFSSPYYEVIFAYNILQCGSVAPNFAGFDGAFCIITNHLCLKLKVFGLKMKKAFEEYTDELDLTEKIREAVQDHQRALDYHVKIQKAYGGWLFAAFLLTSTVISFNLYQLSLSGGADPIYTIFALCAVAHTFTPCYFASQLIQTGQDVCDEIYLARWEAAGNTRVTKMLTFMIARQQKDLILTGNGMVVFNMELFVSVMQTSYSFYTLIRS